MADRSGWVWGVARDHAEMQRADDEWWLALSIEERMALVAEMSQAFEWGDDEEGDAASGAGRASWGIRRRER